MRTLLAVLCACLMWFGSAFGFTGTGVGSVWGMAARTFVASPYDGSSTGVNSMDASFTAAGSGLGQMGPGTEGLAAPGYTPGHCILWARYDAYRIIGTPFEAWPAGVRQMRVDSTGVVLTYGKALSWTNVSGVANPIILQPAGTQDVYIMPPGGNVSFLPFGGGAPIFTVGAPSTIKGLVADSLRTAVRLTPPSYTFSNLPAFPNASIVYCTDCTAASPTAGGGTGNTVLRENGAWNAARSGTGTGETNTASNVGAGTGLIFKQKTGVNLEFKSLLSGTGATVTNNASDITVSATGDTTGLVYSPGRTNGQTILGSTQTTSTSTSFLALRGFTSTSAEAQLLLNGDATLTAGNLNLASQGQTIGLNCNFGAGFSNTTNTGALVCYGIGGNTSISGTPSFAVQNGTSTSVSSATEVIKAKTSQTGPLTQWQGNTGTVVATVDVSGNFTGGMTPGGNINALQGSDIASAASITLTTGNVFRITGTADITSISSRTDGTSITLLFTGTAATNGVVDDDAGLNLSGNLPYVPGTVLVLRRITGQWWEERRSFN